MCIHMQNSIKMNSRQGYKQYFLKGLAKIGLANPALSAYDTLNRSRNVRTLCDVSQDIRDMYSPMDQCNGTVLIFIATTNPVIEFILASALSIRNYNPVLLTNLGSLPRDPEVRYYWDEEARLVLKKFNIRKFQREFGIQVLSIKSILDGIHDIPAVSEVELKKSYHYRGIDISPYALASTRKYLQRYRLDPSEAEHNRIYTDFLQGGVMIARAIEEVTHDQDVIAGISLEGAYVHGGILVEMLNLENVPGYIMGNGRLQNHIDFGLGSDGWIGVNFDPGEVVNFVREFELTNVDQILLSNNLPQTAGEAGRYAKFSPEGGRGLPQSDRFTVGVFSHLLWDAATAPTAGLFTDFFNWLDCTIETLGDDTEVDVYLKAHPAEAKRGTDEFLFDYIDDYYGNLPRNIEFIPPDSHIDFYLMIPELDAGVVYASTVGAELVYNNIPIIIGGYPPYINYGIGYEPSSKQEFIDLLERLPELVVTPEMHKRTERFLYHQFVNKQIHVPDITTLTGDNVDVTIELLTHDSINLIIDSIVSGKTIMRQNLNM